MTRFRFQARLQTLAAIPQTNFYGHPTAALVYKRLSFKRRTDSALNVLYDGGVIGKIARNKEGRFYAFHNILDKGSRGVPARPTLKKAKEDICFDQLHFLQFGDTSNKRIS